VAVYAPPGLRQRSYFAEDPLLDWREVEPSQRVVVRPGPAGGGVAGGGVTLSFVATDHGPPTLAVRLDPAPAGTGPADLGPAFAYSADTGPGWSPGELGSGIGLLLCEATYTREREGEGRHLSGRQAGALAREAGIGQLVLTHRRPSVPAGALRAEADEAFGRPVHQAAAGRVFSW
jgi:ribonuclease BN (tRNA processing enzyme)